MSVQLPRPSASEGTASGRAVIHGKIGIATQQQLERAMLLAQGDKSRELAIDKTPAFNCAAPVTGDVFLRRTRALSAPTQCDEAG